MAKPRKCKLMTVSIPADIMDGIHIYCDEEGQRASVITAQLWKGLLLEKGILEIYTPYGGTREPIKVL